MPECVSEDEGWNSQGELSDRKSGALKVHALT